MNARILLALVLAAGLGCGAPLTPEQQVRAVLDALEASAESGDASAFAELVSPTYSDPYGHDKDGLRAFVAFQVMQSGRAREVILRVRDVSFPEPERAVVALSVGFAGRRGNLGLGAEAYAVDLDVLREGDVWRVSWAQWHPAPPTDLL